jgi:hypothetical protein
MQRGIIKVKFYFFNQRTHFEARELIGESYYKKDLKLARNGRLAYF